jgi:hypothetical protein
MTRKKKETVNSALGISAKRSDIIADHISDLMDEELTVSECLKSLQAKFSENELLFACMSLGYLCGREDTMDALRQAAVDVSAGFRAFIEESHRPSSVKGDVYR